MAKPAQNAKQQIIDKIRDIDTVLVAVNSNPSVDELSAALGVTLALNKLNKHATAVFSGDTPPAITFLDPEKTFENTVDSLRDFIIALDKEKADHLRYKVEGEMVKIFITPYRTTIDDGDLEFSQGDYNVEMVLAIGVRDSDDLDRALAEHGRIMHDATVAGVSIGTDVSDIGSIGWHDNRASSYSELLADLVTKLRTDKDVLDEQIATALLTGIVAATDRFSNERTTSEAMTISAQLMAAGANQQLIATKLEEAEELSQPAGISMDQVTSSAESGGDNGMTKLANNEKTKISHSDSPKSSKSGDKEKSEPIKDRQAPDGSMTISHEKLGSVDEVAEQTERETQAAAAHHAEELLAAGLSQSQPSAAPGLSVADLQNDLKKAANEVDSDAARAGQDTDSIPVESEDVSLPAPAPVSSVTAPEPGPSGHADETAADGADNFIETPIVPASAGKYQSGPSFGGTLNATSEQAAADKRREEELDRNKTILSHDSGSYAASAPAGYPAVNSFNQADDDSTEPQSPVPTPDLGGVSSRGHDLQPLAQSADTAQPAPPAATAPAPTLADLDNQNRTNSAEGAPGSSGDAMAEALSMANSTDQQQQYVPDINALPPLPSDSQTADPALGGMPPLPPMPDFSALPPLPPSPEPQLPSVAPQNQGPVPAQTAGAAPAPNPADPAAFQIPGQ